MGLWNIFPWEWCICMTEPYGSLVEFISRYNCGGGFWWDRRKGFWNLQWNQCLTDKTMAWKYDGGWQRSRIIGKFLRERNQSQIKDQQVQRKHLKIEKVFQVWENTTKIRDEFLWCYTPTLGTDAGTTTLKGTRRAGRLLKKFCRARVLAMQGTAGADIP